MIPDANARTTTDTADADLVRSGAVVVRCARCHRRGMFGYKDKAGGMDWYCEAHRIGCWYADARVAVA
jgi:hypothetical protein